MPTYDKIIETSEYITEVYSKANEARKRYLALGKQGKYPTRKTVGKKKKQYLVIYKKYSSAPTCNIQDDIIPRLGAVGARDSLQKNLENRFK